MNEGFTNALKKSCEHEMDPSFSKQTVRLAEADYPTHVMVSVAECILRKSRMKEPAYAKLPTEKKQGGGDRKPASLVP